jgi:hypothetical protein
MIKISSLTQERREGKAMLTVEENGEIRQEEIRISFKKPTEKLFKEILSMNDGEGEQEKATYVAQLLHVDLQSPDITNDDGTIHAITADDLNALDALQIKALWDGVNEHFFLQMPASTSEMNSNSTSAQTAA